MGNCMRHESSAVWSGDDTGSSARHLLREDDDEPMKKSGSSSSSHESGAAGAREVKIKMTKKELEELVAAADTSGLSIQQLLATFIHQHYHVGDDHVEDHHKSWRPTLQTIPELD